MDEIGAEIHIDSTEVREHVGHLLVEEGHKLRMLGEEDMALEMETAGRQMIEEARNSDEEWVGGSQFEDTLYNVE